MRRKLAAILMADVVGYSRLAGSDETYTLTEFKQHMSAYIRPAIRRCHGRLVKTMGDGFLAEFDSAVNAVECALSLQQGAALRNALVEVDRQLRFRIGINLGDVVFEDDDVLGDGVNVAARLQTLAEPGGIVVSQSIAQHLGGKLDVLLEDLGNQALKNIAQPVHAFRARIPPALAHSGVKTEHAASTPTVAVLPLVNLSKDPEQSYFSDGITEDMITELSRFRTLSVVARTSSFVYRDRSVDVKQIANELNVQFVVEGSVRQIDQRVRITVQLIHAGSRRHVWAEKYDVGLQDIFSVQDDITRRVVATIVPKIEAEELEIARRRPTSHMRAYDCYLRGKAKYHAAADGPGKIEARRLFEEAIRLDPEFARPYCYLAAIDNSLALFSAAGTSLAPLREQAKQFALKAAALDDSDPLTHLSLAWSHLWRREFDAARKHLDIATALNPNDADRAMDRGTTLMYLGEPDAAIDIMLGAMRLNPFHPESYIVDLAEAYFTAHRYDDMIRLAEQIQGGSPSFMAWKAAAYAYSGREQDARRCAEQFVNGVHAIWGGDPAAGPNEYVEWLMSFCPFRRQEDADHLVLGLQRAGLTAHRER
jgi:TolB-like protein/class 3 adenylate cyclase